MIIKKILWFSYLPIDLVIIFISTWKHQLDSNSEQVEDLWAKIKYRVKFSYRLAKQLAYDKRRQIWGNIAMPQWRYSVFNTQ